MVELRKPIAVNVPIIGGLDHGTGKYIKVALDVGEMK